MKVFSAPADFVPIEQIDATAAESRDAEAVAPGPSRPVPRPPSRNLWNLGEALDVSRKTDRTRTDAAQSLTLSEEYEEGDVDENGHVVTINNPEHNQRRKFSNNYISTTKYSVYNFIPKNLFEQFRRFSNLYFLFVSGIQLVPGLSPVSPWTTMAPLLLVLGITAFKEAVEDIRRHKADRAANRTVFKIVRSTEQRGAVHLQEVVSKNILTGDLILIEKGQQFPADIVLLSSSNGDGSCCIETSNLDGESNLKLMKAPKASCHLQTPDMLAHLRGKVVCEKPNERLYQFHAHIRFEHVPNEVALPDDDRNLSDRRRIPLSHQQLLLRGARLRHTPFVYGIVVYTGKDSKLSLNNRSSRLKRSHLDVLLNRYILGIFCIQIVLCCLAGLMAGLFEKNQRYKAWYLEKDDLQPWSYGVLHVLTYFVLFSTFIPVSLFITMELVRLCQAVLMEWDEEMMGDTEMENSADSNMKAKTSNLNEELGKVEYVFSDKTGTLTENCMIFAKCCLQGVVFDELNHPGRLCYTAFNDDGSAPPVSYAATEFLRMMAACNTVMIDSREVRPKTRQNVSSSLSTPRGQNFADMSFRAGGSARRLIRSTSAAGPSQMPMPDSLGMEDLENVESPRSVASPVVFRPHRVWESEIKPLSPRRTLEDINGNPRSTETGYEAQSADELALVIAAKNNGCELKMRTTDSLTLIMDGEHEVFSLLATLEFTSDRKRMSVVLLNPSGRIQLYCKGADTAVLSRLSDEQDQGTLRATVDRMEAFSQEGLRTLVFASRYVSQEEFDTWLPIFLDAQSAIVNREEKVAAACDLLEKGLDLIGCSAVLDCLQQEVPETIEFLKQAGIVVWLLTGDKQETATTVGYTSCLLHRDMKILTVNATSSANCEEILRSVLSAHSTEDCTAQERGLIIDGTTLTYALLNYSDLLLAVCRLCTAVVCCRVTPLQKAQVVSLVKSKLKKICLAIGDGANDVSMILEAHVGVGIIGMEGSQAARASDYAISQFRFLRRLIAVHGRYSYLRLVNLIQYSFYKNLAFTLPQLLFSIYNGWTGTALYDDWVIAAFNVLFSSLPPMVFGIFEKDLDEEIIEANPEVHRRILTNAAFSIKTLIFWYMAALWHAAVAFYVPMYLWLGTDTLDSSGLDVGFLVSGTAVSTAAIVAVILKAAVEFRYWTWLSHVSLWASLIIYVVFIHIDSALPLANPKMLDVASKVLWSPSFWVFLPLVALITILPDLVCNYTSRQYFPADWQILQEHYLLPGTRLFISREELSQESMTERSP